MSNNLRASLLILAFAFINLTSGAQTVTWTVYNTSNSGLISNQATSLCVDWDNRLWIGTGGGLSVFKNGSWLNSLLTSSPIAYASHLGLWSSNDDSTVWFGTEYQSLWSVKNNTWINHQPNIIGNGIIDFAKDSYDSLWILDKFGHFATGDSTIWTDRIPYVDHAAFLKLDPTHTFWIGSGNQGLIKYHLGSIFRYSQNYNPSLSNFIPNPLLTCMDFDTSGHIWLGTQSQGLIYYDGSSWYEYNTTTCGIPADDITTLRIDADNHLWIGTFQHGIIVYDGVHWTNFHTGNSPLPSNWIKAIAVDHSGIVWVAGTGIAKLVPLFSSVEENVARLTMDAWPNPAKDLLTLNFASPQHGTMDIKVRDLYGHELLHQNVTKTTHELKLTLDLSAYASQMLILNVVLNNTTVTEKIIKM